MWVHPKEYETVGLVLADARMRAKLTQQQLAKKLRKPQSFVSSYERGQRRIDVLEFLRVSEVLGSDPVVLLSDIIARQSGSKVPRQALKKNNPTPKRRSGTAL